MADGPDIKADVKIDVTADLTEINDKFWDTVSKGAGAWFKPTMTVREAKAAGKSALIKVKADAKIAKVQQKAWLESEEFEQKALALNRQRAMRDFQNINAIAEKAAPQLTAGAKPEAVEDDWMANLIDKARLVSNEQMQNVWSRVLAGEANRPGSFSRRTVNFLADLDQADCEMFTTLACFHCMIGEDPEDAAPLILAYEDSVYQDHGITFDLLHHLESIGLIAVNFRDTYWHRGARYPFSYFDTHLTITVPDGAPDKVIPIGIAIYTKVGRELVKIAGAKPIPEFLSFIRSRWAHLFNEPVHAT